MNVIKLAEHGYDQSVLGFSLSYNTSLERTKQILPKYAFGKPGENKFLEHIEMWWDITAPRFWWQEADTYRLSSKQSESTMHTLCKTDLTNDNFEYPVPESILNELNEMIKIYRIAENAAYKKVLLSKIKNLLPEGFLQRRIWCFNYKTLQNIYIQRKDHRLLQWNKFINSIMMQIDHPEFLIPNYFEKETNQ